LLYDAPRRRNHDAERRATKYTNPSSLVGQRTYGSNNSEVT